jgi:hypothetical protein
VQPALGDHRADRRDVVDLAAHRAQRFAIGEIAGAAPAAARQVLDDLVRVIDQGQRVARRTRLLARLAPRTSPPGRTWHTGTIGRGRLRGVARVAAQPTLELRDLRRELLDHPSLLGDQREQLLTRRLLQPGHKTTRSPSRDRHADDQQRSDPEWLQLDTHASPSAIG